MTKYGAGSSVDTIATSKIIAIDTLQSQDNAPHFTGCWVGSLQSNLRVLCRMDGNRPAGIKGSNNGVPSSPPPLLLSIPIDLWDWPGNIIIPIRWLDIPPSTVRRRVLLLSRQCGLRLITPSIHSVIAIQCCRPFGYIDQCDLFLMRYTFFSLPIDFFSSHPLTILNYNTFCVQISPCSSSV